MIHPNKSKSSRHPAAVVEWVGDGAVVDVDVEGDELNVDDVCSYAETNSHIHKSIINE